MKNKCKIFTGTVRTVEKEMNDFFLTDNISVEKMTQTEHSTKHTETLYITITLVYVIVSNTNPRLPE